MVLTIREAASITDDTYTYQDVVNMMADLIAALKGDMMVCDLCILANDFHQSRF